MGLQLKKPYFFPTGFVWRCPAIVNHSPAPGLSFSSCPRSGSAGSVSPGRWGPSPTPPGFRGTRPGAGAPLPHRLRLPLKPLRSGHRFLGSPSQGQAGWPTGGACKSGSEAPRLQGRAVAPPGSRTGSRTPRPAEIAKAFGSWAVRTLARRSFLGGRRLQARRSPDQKVADTGRRGGVLTSREHPTRPAAEMWGEGGQSKRAGTRS